MAQPPLSQQIRKLEELVGHRLFDRTTRGVRLTAVGDILAERARGEEGTLTVGFAGSVMFTGLPAAVEAYRRPYPNVDLRLRESVTSAQIAALLALGGIAVAQETEGRGYGPLASTARWSCEKSGFRPRIVQEAPQWPTLVRLVAAGLGVSLAPACVASIAIPGAAYREIHNPARTTVDLAVKAGADKVLPRNFMQIARQRLAG